MKPSTRSAPSKHEYALKGRHGVNPDDVASTLDLIKWVSTISLLALLVIPLRLGGTVERDDVWLTRVLVNGSGVYGS
jgi:hypothetical protein